MDINIMMHSMAGGSGKGHPNSFKSSHYLSPAAKTFTAMNVEANVSLNMDVNPPILITPQGSVGGKQTGQKRNLWNSLRNMFSVSTATTWVNPEYMHMPPPPPPPPFQEPIPGYQDPYYLNQQLLKEGPYNDPQMDGLWYPARPGGNQWELLDPLMYPWLTGNQQVDSFKSVTGDHQSTNVLTDFMTKKVSPPIKCQKPLNPEAKEWIPQEMRDIKECISSFSTLIENTPLIDKSSIDTPVNEIIEKKSLPVCTTSSENMNSTTVNQPSSSNENNDFCEITDVEIKAVRDAKLKTNSSGNNKEHIKLGRNIFDSKIKKQNMSQEKRSSKVRNKFDCNGTTITNDQIIPGCDSKVNIGKKVCDSNISTSPNVSYANIAGKSPEPVCLIEPPCGKDIVLTSNEQQLAKILTKDKKYPKEKATLSVNNIRNPITPFKTCSKSQKKVRKKFLDELKTFGIDSQADDSCSILSSSLPSTVGSPCPIPSACEIIPGIAISPSIKSSERSISESSSGGSRSFGDRHRSISESSSAFSLDIEFEDNKDEKQSTEQQTTKCNNDILKHILGLQDDSDTDSEDDSDDDSDWDEVDAEDTVNTWEFTPSFMALQGLCKVQESLCQGKSSEELCDNTTFTIIELDDDPYEERIKEINKKWNDTYLEIISPRDSQVTFGDDEEIVPELTWSDEDLTNSRRGPWEQYARDRMRFKSRIDAVESSLLGIFDNEHRQTVYTQRFMNHDS